MPAYLLPRHPASVVTDTSIVGFWWRPSRADPWHSSVGGDVAVLSPQVLAEARAVARAIPAPALAGVMTAFETAEPHFDVAGARTRACAGLATPRFRQAVYRL